MKLLIFAPFVCFGLLLSSNSSITTYCKQDPKVKKIDTIKKKSFVEEKATTDSVLVYKGKFKPYKKNAHASYYHDKFSGRLTASGKKFNNNELTAAHKKLPFGTKVKVTNEVNGKSVILEITDRGPFVKGREIDLSKRAFMAIAHNKGSGLVIVTIEELVK